MDGGVLLVIGLVGCLVFSMLGVWIADQKNRGIGEGFFLGLFFGPFGCLIEALMPTLQRQEPPAPRTKSPEQLEWERRQREELEEIRKREAATEAAALAEWNKAQQRRKETAAARWAWFDRKVVRFGWYKDLPDVLQPIVLGVGVAAPLLTVLIWMISPRTEPEAKPATTKVNPLPAPSSTVIEAPPPAGPTEADRLAAAQREAEKQAVVQREAEERAVAEQQAEQRAIEQREAEARAELFARAKEYEDDDRPRGAVGLYEDVITKYPGTSEAIEAARRIKILESE